MFVDLVTIDIGANDVIFGGGVPAIEANLPVILAALRNAVGPGVPIVGMTCHDPFLAFIWFTSFDLGALQAEANSHVLNGALEHIYGSFGDPVAEVDQAFSNNDTTIQPNGLPLDVLRICEWTWTCVVGESCGWSFACFDPHPNAIGYGVIALGVRGGPAVRAPRHANGRKAREATTMKTLLALATISAASVLAVPTAQAHPARHLHSQARQDTEPHLFPCITASSRDRPPPFSLLTHVF
jgi:GDSL-like Lipase/Acylhydrolase family